VDNTDFFEQYDAWLKAQPRIVIDTEGSKKEMAETRIRIARLIACENERRRETRRKIQVEILDF